MKDRKKRNIIIGSLCCLLVFMAVGYAILSQALNISGNANLSGEWKIYIESITEITEGNTTSGKSIYTELIGNEKTEAYFEVDLRKPGDYVEYKVIVKNAGNIDATLRELATYSNIEHSDVVFSHTLEQGALLKGGETKEFTVKVEFLKSATEIPEDTYLDYTMYMLYEQFDGNTMTTPPNLETDNSCFTVSADGTLEGYDYNCGLDVTVPASVNGTNITKITEDSFMPTDEQAQEMGYGKFFVTEFLNDLQITGIPNKYWVAEDFAYNKLIEAGYADDYLAQMASNPYDVIVNAKFEEVEIYTYYHAYTIDSTGDYNSESPEFILYQYSYPQEFYVVENEKAYAAALLCFEKDGLDTNLLYIDGDSNIPLDSYKVKLIDIIEGKYEKYRITQNGVFYANGSVVPTYVNNLSTLFTSLDLSKAKYLESITGVRIFTGLTKLVLPENGSLTTIGDSVFRETKFTSVTIPSTVTSIEDGAFLFADSLEEIRINRKNSTGITFGYNWKDGNVTVKYIG